MNHLKLCIKPDARWKEERKEERRKEKEKIAKHHARQDLPILVMDFRPGPHPRGRRRKRKERNCTIFPLTCPGQDLDQRAEMGERGGRGRTGNMPYNSSIVW